MELLNYKVIELLKSSSTGNVEAKELICMTHGHELKGGNVGGRGCTGWRGIKGENGTTVIA